MYTASNYSEEVSSSVEKFDSQFCYPEQDSLNHFLRDLHVVYEGMLSDLYIHACVGSGYF